MNLLSRSRFLPALLLFAGANAWGAGPGFNILDYGARNDGSASATTAIRSAIQAAKAAGGGTVYVPAGKYVTGPIELVSNLVLQIDAGAVLRFEASRDGLTYTKGRLEGTECITPVPLIGGHDLENVAIRGRGTITTDNAQWMNLVRQPDAAAARTVWTGILKALDLRRPVALEDFQKAAPSLRPSFIRTMESKNILIEGIHIVGSPMWTIHILYSQNVVIRGLTIETFPGVNTDGMDIDSSQDVLISNCYLDTGDDAICLKSGKDADGMRVNRPTANVAIANCTVHHGHGAVVLGSETSGGIHNIVASNSGEPRIRTGFPDTGFQGAGTGPGVHAHTGCGKSCRAAGPLPGRHRAGEQGFCGHGHVSGGGSRRIKEHRARRQCTRQRQEGHRRNRRRHLEVTVAGAYSKIARVTLAPIAPPSQLAI